MRVCTQCGAPCNEEDRFCASCGSALSTDSQSASSDPLLGRTVGGSYTLQEIIGVGGMGRVYRAEQSMLGRTVAVKVIHPHLLSDEQTVARFYNEARAASRLNHPNSVGIIDFGRTDDGVLYLVMEHISGKDLALIMHEEGPLPFPRICDLMIAVLDALGEAHALGVVHRDLKPENIIIRHLRTGTDLVKVVDFGLATIVGGGGTSITRPGLVCGTPDYMAPEQGRGEDADARGDLYSLGVVLFELLTESLPYEDETPTKVVLRHINDPIPDPREKAPHRHIPGVMADVCMHALGKRADARYQTAAEFQTALRKARSKIEKPEKKTGAMMCAACGAENPPGMRFCGACGARLTGRVSVPAELRPARGSLRPQLPSHRPLVDRLEELEQLEGLREAASTEPVRARVVGEPGVGKTRLLREVAERFEKGGDLVTWAGPHPTGAPVPYVTVRSLLGALLGVEDDDLARLATTDGVLDDPLTRAGVAEVVEPAGLAGTDGSSRTGAVAVALATAANVALGREGRKRLVVIVEDLNRCDGLSQQAIAAWPRFHPNGAVLIVGSSTTHQTIGREEERAVDLRGFTVEEAQEFLAAGTDGEPRASVPPAPGKRYLLPLYLEQLQALGIGLSGEESVPPRLADVVMQRVERLDVQARRILQAAAVLGDRADLELLRKVGSSSDMVGLDTLQRSELIRLTEDGIEIVHPFIRDLVEASIPAEARKELHQRALQATSESDAPLEVRADHAYRAGEPMSALMLLERMGDVALARGDAVAGVLAYRRGLEIARREMLESGDVVMDRAIVTFSRKLGQALERAGDIAGADGVLREALDLTGPSSTERAQMLLALGEVAGRRERRRDALRLLGQALEIADTEQDRQTEAKIQLALARVRRDEGDASGAASSYGRALESMNDAELPASLRARAGLELGETLLDSEDMDTAAEQLQRAYTLAEECGASALMASSVGTLGRIDEAQSRRDEAARRYEDAARLAADAGDAAGYASWRRAAAGLAQDGARG